MILTKKMLEDVRTFSVGGTINLSSGDSYSCKRYCLHSDKARTDAAPTTNSSTHTSGLSLNPSASSSRIMSASPSSFG